MSKAQSLAAQTPGALAEGLKLPSIFSAPQEKVVARFVSPYMVFAHPKRADEWAKIVAKAGAAQEGDMYLVEPERVTHLSTAKLGWLCHRQYWAEVNAAGQPLRISWAEMPKPFKEHIESVVLVYLEDRIVPANASFRSTKCPAAKTLADALGEASTPAWAERSPAHKESIICSQPFMRFYGEVNLGPQRTSKSSGLTYRTTVCSVKPTSVQEWRLLKEFCENEATQKKLEDAAQRFQFRVDELMAIK